MTLYELLGVAPDAKPELIKRAYRTLVKTAHPDAGGDPDVFVAIVHAYDILMDPDERAYYDQHGVEREAPTRDDEEAIQILVTTLSSILHSTGEMVETIDIVEEIRKHINNSFLRADKMLLSAMKMKARMERVRKRIKHKGKGHNFIDGHIGMQIAAAEQQIAYSRDEKEQITKALALLDQYDWDDGFAPWQEKSARTWDEITQQMKLGNAKA